MLAHLVGFVAGSLLVVTVVVSLLTGLVAMRVPPGSPGFGEAMVAASEDPTYVGPATLAQGLGLAVLALALGGWLPSRTGRVVEVFALRAPSAVMLGTALLGGLTVWIWPSWFAAQLVEITGLDTSVESIGKLLAGPLDETLAMIAAVTIAAPLAEELLFRGYLWRLVEGAGGSPRVAFAITTVLFALYHMDPVHVVALLPTAAFFGWLRLASGSLWTSVLAHFLNNAAAVAFVRLAPEGAEIGTVGAFVALAVFLAVALAGAALSRPRAS